MKIIIAIIGCATIVHIALMLPRCSHHIPTINNYTTYLHLQWQLPLVKFSISSSLICCIFRCIILCSLTNMSIKAHQTILSQYRYSDYQKLASAAVFVAHYKLISNLNKKFHWMWYDVFKAKLLLHNFCFYVNGFILLPKPLKLIHMPFLEACSRIKVWLITS
jgi:hypothetical protein